MHIDALFARRTPFGGPIVHGSLLDARCPRLPAGRGARRVSAGSRFRLAARFGPARRSRRKRGTTVTGTRGRCGCPAAARRSSESSHGRRQFPDRSFGLPRQRPGGRCAASRLPRTRAMDRPGAKALQGPTKPAPALAEIARQRNAGAIDPVLVEALGWASYVVGMELPGLHGLFAAAKLSALERVAGGDAAGQLFAPHSRARPANRVAPARRRPRDSARRDSGGRARVFHASGASGAERRRASSRRARAPHRAAPWS